MVEWTTHMMESLGYWGIGLLMFFPPIPSELIMPLVGFTIARGTMDFVPAIAAGVIGTVLGSLPWYFAGVYFGERRLRNWADRYGKWVTLSSRDIERSITWFNQYGNAAVFLCRMVPGVRTLISLPAGLGRMNLGLFLLYSTGGTLIWTSLLTFTGYLLGDNYEQVEHYLGPVSKIVPVLLLVALGICLWRRQRPIVPRI